MRPKLAERIVRNNLKQHQNNGPNPHTHQRPIARQAFRPTAVSENSPPPKIAFSQAVSEHLKVEDFMKQIAFDFEAPISQSFH